MPVNPKSGWIIRGDGESKLEEIEPGAILETHIGEFMPLKDVLLYSDLPLLKIEGYYTIEKITDGNSVKIERQRLYRDDEEEFN